MALLYLGTVPNGQEEIKQNILEKFLSNWQEPLQQYSATRHMEAKNQRLGIYGFMDVETSLTGKMFSYKVISEEGSDYIRHNILRKVLNQEKELQEKSGDEKITFSHKNYFFRQIQETEDGLTKLFATPRNKNDLVAESTLFVDGSGTIIRSTGKLTKNPSFFVRDVSVEITYKQIQGVRLPIHIKSTAKIRFFGQSVFEMWYTYKSVNKTEVSESK